MQTLKEALSSEEDCNLTSPALENRQRSPIQGNKAIIEHTAKNFRIPNSFDHWIYVSQILQATAIKTAVEHWRRLKP